MEIKNKEQVTEFLELMNRGNYFTKLKQENKIEKSFVVPIKVSCYNELNIMISDLLKASILILTSDTENLSNCTTNTNINALTLLEIALQLLPEEEMELLDDLHKIHLQSDATLLNKV
ncbi:hypothetical protein GKZ90_0014715 [Flavobacterium sp. MC2016-06]|uniref:hypothetical protein n=1 Tax=Flavobacterium sp. MC2016-06 TaxID=2676308 RepID=UPI0012BA9DF5|nr:hypothetical protein [Flavobacterium sp. MC2016-06]MBU3859272.1 hypothetical protein [Flavobacterium sp. MC2016-06]